MKRGWAIAVICVVILTGLLVALFLDARNGAREFDRRLKEIDRDVEQIRRNRP